MNKMVNSALVSTVFISCISSSFFINSEKVKAKTSTNYTVKSGDYLYGIALKNGLTLSELKKLNNLKSNTIYIGQKLNITAKKLSTKPKTSTTSKTSVVKSVSNATYIVKSGDSLSSIGYKYNMYLADLKSINKLKSDIIYVGQKLKIKKSTSTKNIITSNPTNKISKTSNSVKKYMVKSGDSLSTIAMKYNVTISSIKTWNKLNSNTIYIGQNLYINGTNSTTNSTTKIASSNTTNKGYVNGINTANIIQSITHTSKNSYSNKIINQGLKYLGVPYVWGGSSPNALDCSGFVYRVYNEVGIPVPRTTSRGFYAMAKKISPSNVQVGDLVFFAEDGNTITHISIYYGNGQLLHASGDRVNIQKMNNTYWNKRVVGYGRIR